MPRLEDEAYPKRRQSGAARYWTHWTGNYNGDGIEGALFTLAWIVTGPSFLLFPLSSTVLGATLLLKRFRPTLPAVLLALVVPLAFGILQVTSMGSAALPVMFAFGIRGRRIARRVDDTGATGGSGCLITSPCLGGSRRHPWAGGASVSDLKEELHRKLQAARAGVLSKLDGLSEYDLRRPMTPTGTNLLGLVKHLAGVEYGYLGDSFNRPASETMSWIEGGSIWESADMWATPDESSEYLIGLYQRACAHADQTIADLDLDTPGLVAHWPEGRRETTLGFLLIRMVAETAQHAGHADIVRELIDGRAGPDHDAIGSGAWWREYVAAIQAAADSFATGAHAEKPTD